MVGENRKIRKGEDSIRALDPDDMQRRGGGEVGRMVCFKNRERDIGSYIVEDSKLNGKTKVP